MKYVGPLYHKWGRLFHEINTDEKTETKQDIGHLSFFYEQNGWCQCSKTVSDPKNPPSELFREQKHCRDDFRKNRFHCFFSTEIRKRKFFFFPLPSFFSSLDLSRLAKPIYVKRFIGIDLNPRRSISILQTYANDRKSWNMRW